MATELTTTDAYFISPIRTLLLPRELSLVALEEGYLEGLGPPNFLVPGVDVVDISRDLILLEPNNFCVWLNRRDYEPGAA